MGFSRPAMEEGPHVCADCEHPKGYRGACPDCIYRLVRAVEAATWEAAAREAEAQHRIAMAEEFRRHAGGTHETTDTAATMMEIKQWTIIWIEGLPVWGSWLWLLANCITAAGWAYILSGFFWKR